jgi:ribosomal protein L30/L7E
MLVNIALEYTRTVRKVQENLVGLKLNRIHHLLVYADDVNLLEDNINTTKKEEKL